MNQCKHPEAFPASLCSRAPTLFEPAPWHWWQGGATQRPRVEELVGVGPRGLCDRALLPLSGVGASFTRGVQEVPQLRRFNAWEWFSYSFYPSSSAESGLGGGLIQHHSTPAFGSVPHKGSPQAEPCSAAHRLSPGQTLLGVEAKSGCTGLGLCGVARSPGSAPAAGGGCGFHRAPL